MLSVVKNLLSLKRLLYFPKCCIWSWVIVQTSSMGGLCRLFDVRLVMRMFATCFKKRDHHRRTIIFLVVIALSTCVITLEGKDVLPVHGVVRTCLGGFGVPTVSPEKLQDNSFKYALIASYCIFTCWVITILLFSVWCCVTPGIGKVSWNKQRHRTCFWEEAWPSIFRKWSIGYL
jgi:hypothetical protein